MDSIYPFDPYNWATITPLFETLLEAPVSQGGFADWLAQWNDLDIAVYDAWAELKRRSYSNTADLAAEHAYQVYTREIFSTYLGLTNALATRALALQPEPPNPSDKQQRRYNLLYQNHWQFFGRPQVSALCGRSGHKVLIVTYFTAKDTKTTKAGKPIFRPSGLPAFLCSSCSSCPSCASW